MTGSPTSSAAAARRCGPRTSGCAQGRRRRTAGLRREEVALLAHMSTDFYARLEQRRGSRPSEQTVGALARALRLTQDERDHLFQLAGHVAPPRGFRSDHVTPALLRVLDRLDTPAHGRLRPRRRPRAEPARRGAARRADATSPASRAASSTAGSPIPPSANAGRTRTTPIHSRSYAASLRLAHGRDPEGAQELVGRAAAPQRGVRRAVGAPRGRRAQRHPQARSRTPRSACSARLPDPDRREPARAAGRLHRRARHRRTPSALGCWR